LFDCNSVLSREIRNEAGLRSEWQDYLLPSDCNLVLAVDLCRPGYDLVDPEAFFFWVGFRHPAVFLETLHPCRFFARGFFQLLFLFA
jgi:hypothetical protein